MTHPSSSSRRKTTSRSAPREIPEEGETVGADRRNELLLLEDQNCRRLFRPDDFEPVPIEQCEWTPDRKGSIRVPIRRWVYQTKENPMIEKMLEDLHETLLALKAQHGHSDSGRVVSIAATDVEKLRAWVQAYPVAFRGLDPSSAGGDGREEERA